MTLIHQLSGSRRSKFRVQRVHIDALTVLTSTLIWWPQCTIVT